MKYIQSFHFRGLKGCSIRIALFVPDLSGHRVHWLQHSLSDAQKIGIEVVVYTSDVTQSNWIKDNLMFTEVNFIVMKEKKELLRRWRNDLKSEDVEGACFESDKILLGLLFVKAKLRLLIMRPYLEETSLPGIIRFGVKQFLIMILSARKSIKISRLAIPYSRRPSRNFRWIRDEYNTELFNDQNIQPVIPLEILDIPEGSKVVTLCGFLQARKSPKAAYEIVKKLRSIRSQQLYLILAGIQDDDFKTELSSIGKLINVIQIDRLLSESEFKGLLISSHLILLPYKNRGASGIVLNSLVLGTPVFLHGSKNWKRLQDSLSGRFIVSRRNRFKQIDEINALLDLPKESALPALLEEKIPTLSDFLFQEIF